MIQATAAKNGAGSIGMTSFTNPFFEVARSIKLSSAVIFYCRAGRRFLLSCAVMGVHRSRSKVWGPACIASAPGAARCQILRWNRCGSRVKDGFMLKLAICCFLYDLMRRSVVTQITTLMAIVTMMTILMKLLSNERRLGTRWASPKQNPAEVNEKAL